MTSLTSSSFTLKKFLFSNVTLAFYLKALLRCAVLNAEPFKFIWVFGAVRRN